MPPSSSPTLAIKACRSEAFIAYFNALDPRDSDKGGKGRGAAAGVTSLEELADGRVWSRVLHSVSVLSSSFSFFLRVFLNGWSTLSEN